MELNHNLPLQFGVNLLLTQVIWLFLLFDLLLLRVIHCSKFWKYICYNRTLGPSPTCPLHFSGFAVLMYPYSYPFTCQIKNKNLTMQTGPYKPLTSHGSLCYHNPLRFCANRSSCGYHHSESCPGKWILQRTNLLLKVQVHMSWSFVQWGVSFSCLQSLFSCYLKTPFCKNVDLRSWFWEQNYSLSSGCIQFLAALGFIFDNSETSFWLLPKVGFETFFLLQVSKHQ